MREKTFNNQWGNDIQYFLIFYLLYQDEVQLMLHWRKKEVSLPNPSVSQEKGHVPKFLVSVSIKIAACCLHGANWYFFGKDAFSGWLDVAQMPCASSLERGGSWPEGDGLWARDPAMKAVHSWEIKRAGKQGVHLSSSFTTFFLSIWPERRDRGMLLPELLQLNIWYITCLNLQGNAVLSWVLQMTFKESQQLISLVRVHSF